MHDDNDIEAPTPETRNPMEGMPLPDLRGVNRGLRVLLIEDSEIDAELIGQALAADKRIEAVQTAENGEQALTLLKSFTPDLILTDLNMPMIDGMELLRRLRREEDEEPVDIFMPHGRAKLRMPIVVLTSSRRIEDFHDAISTEANCFVTKPSTLTELRSLLRKVVHSVISGQQMPRHLSVERL